MMPVSHCLAPPSLSRWRWVVLVGAHLALIVVDGIPNSTGVLLVHWKTQFETTTAKLSVVLSIQLGAYHFAGAIAGTAIHKLGLRPVVIASGAVSCVGLILSSLAPSPWVLYITAGLLTGAGFGSTLNAATVAIAQYFQKYYGIAQSLASAGSAVGIVILPPVTQFITLEYGWRGTYVIFAALAGNIIVCGMLLRPVESFPPDCSRKTSQSGVAADAFGLRETANAVTQFDGDMEDLEAGEEMEEERPDKEGQEEPDCKYEPLTETVDMSPSRGVLEVTSCDADEDDDAKARDGYQALRQRRQSRLQSIGGATGVSLLCSNFRFLLLCSVIFFAGVSMSAVMNHLVLSVLDRGISEQAASFLMSFFGIGSIIGKLVSALVLGRQLLGVTPFFIVSSMAWGVSVMLLRAPTSYGGFVVVALSVGIFSGINICTAAIVTRNVVGVAKLGRAFGILMVFAGTGCLIGPVLAGWIYDKTQSFDISFFSFGAVLTAACIPLFFLDNIKSCEDRHLRQRCNQNRQTVPNKEEENGTIMVHHLPTEGGKDRDEVEAEEDGKSGQEKEGSSGDDPRAKDTIEEGPKNSRVTYDIEQNTWESKL